MKTAWCLIIVSIILAIFDVFIEKGTILWTMYISMFIAGLYKIFRNEYR